MKWQSVLKSGDSHIKFWRAILHFLNKMTISTRLCKRRQNKSAHPPSAQGTVIVMQNLVSRRPKHNKARIRTLSQPHLPLMRRDALWPWIRRRKISSRIFFYTRESPQNSKRLRKLTMRASSPWNRASQLNTAKRCSLCARRDWANLISILGELSSLRNPLRQRGALSLIMDSQNFKSREATLQPLLRKLYQMVILTTWGALSWIIFKLSREIKWIGEHAKRCSWLLSLTSQSNNSDLKLKELKSREDLLSQ